jgi:hypothetical protein
VTRALESSRKALRQALDLYSCGYNCRNAEELGEPDDNDKTEKDYERDADRIRDTIISAIGDVRKALAQGAATPQG